MKVNEKSCKKRMFHVKMKVAKYANMKKGKGIDY